MVDKIACFLTCGYTEAGAMQFFLKKINDKYDYKQYLPNKTRKKKGDAKILNQDICGLTGDSLLEKIYEILEKHKEEIGRCKAVFLEIHIKKSFMKHGKKRAISVKTSIPVKWYHGKEQKSETAQKVGRTGTDPYSVCRRALAEFQNRKGVLLYGRQIIDQQDSFLC